MELEGQVAIITGAGHGIGRATALELARAYGRAHRCGRAGPGQRRTHRGRSACPRYPLLKQQMAQMLAARRGSRRPSNVAQIVCRGICREYRSYRVSDRKIAARCPDVPRDLKCRQSPDYHDFTISSVFSATDQPPKRSAMLTANWRG